jgi:isopentenyl diphosphate isomerase/L-lactate dehydrogenase-like FMN-dependent dehydrogenase
VRLAEVRELIRLRRPELDPVQRVVARCHSIEDVREAARRKLPRAVFDYVDGGADEENTVAANRTALRQWAFQPQILHDVSAPDLSVELFGHRLPAPLGLAPTGYTRMVNPVGETGVAIASASTGLPYGLSTVGSTSIEDLAASGHPRLWFQLYALRDRSVTRSLVERAAVSGYKVLEVSVDTHVAGNRARDVRNGMTIPPQLTVRTVLDIGRHLSYWTAMLRSPMLTVPNMAVPNMAVTNMAATNMAATNIDGPNSVAISGTEANGTDGRRRGETVAEITSRFDPSLDWDDLFEIRQWWSGPLLLKGPVGPGDAVRAIDAGVDGLHLSNHGGRQLDGTVATIDLVRPVRDAVGNRAVIVMDSGVRHGADIAVALARGADMCMIGRPYLYGLAAAGPAGVRRVIDILVEQFRRTMQLLGVASVAELRRHADQLVVEKRPSERVWPQVGELAP